MSSVIANIVRPRLWRAVLVLILITKILHTRIDSQMTSACGDLLNFIATEQQRGPVLTYAQSYIDNQNERVSYTGTLYTGIQLFKIYECNVTARVAAEDRYSGAIEHRSDFRRVHFEQTGELTDDTVYEYRFSLAELKTDGVHDLRAVPADVDINTSIRCEEDRACNLSWIQLTDSRRSIAENRNRQRYPEY
jgi:hypothetical protein